MAGKIAVVGNGDSISYFRIIGCRVFNTGRGGLAEEDISELRSGKYEIIYVTEEAYRMSTDFFKGEDGMKAAVTIIPDIRGAVWKDGKPRSTGLSMEEIRHAVIKAVGQDISGPEEE